MNNLLIFSIAKAMLLARWKQTLVAAIGVTFGITMFIALLSFMTINDPAIIMGDEPTGNLDKKNTDVVFDIFQRLSKEFNQTMLIVTHDQEFAKKKHRIIEMEDGRIINN